MMPNLNKKFEQTEMEMLFQCECHGNHFLEVLFDKDYEENLWFEFIDYPNSLWSTLKWWWKQRKVWTSEIELTKDDVRKLIEVLNNYLNK